MFNKVTIGLAVLGVISVGVCVRFIHLRNRHQGVTDEEVHRFQPGDEQGPDPAVTMAQAVTIDASPEQVVPHLEQMGYRRVDWDAFTYLDHGNIQSAGEIIPIMGRLDAGQAAVKEDFTEPVIAANRPLLFVSYSPGAEHIFEQSVWPICGECSQVFILEPIDDGHTRLISRTRYAFPHGSHLLWKPLVKGAKVLIQSRILLAIKHHVERSRNADRQRGALPFGRKGGQRVKNRARHSRSVLGRFALTSAIMLCMWGVSRHKGVLPFGDKAGQRMHDLAQKSRDVWGFFLLTYAMMVCTWGVMALFKLKGASSLPNAPKPSPGELLLFLLGGCSPSLAGIIMIWCVGGRSGLAALWRRTIQFKLGWQWYMVTLLPLFSALLLIGVYLLRGGALNENVPLFHFISLMSFALGLFVTGPLTEEVGWRGFALDRLLARWDPLRASLILGLLWSFWHLPLFFIPNSIQQQTGIAEFPVFLVSIMSKTVLMTWVYLATRRSFWSAIWFHFTCNFAETSLRSLTGGARAYRLLHNGLTAAMAAAVALAWSRRTPARAAGVG
jgi:CAAX protease family protein